MSRKKTEIFFQNLLLLTRAILFLGPPSRLLALSNYRSTNKLFPQFFSKYLKYLCFLFTFATVCTPVWTQTFVNPCPTGVFSGWQAVTNIGPNAAGGNPDCGGNVYSVTNTTVYPGQTAPGFAPNSNGLLRMVPAPGVPAVQLFSGHGDDATDWARVCETTTVPANTTCLSFDLAGVFEDYHYNSGTDQNGDAYFDVRILAGAAACAVNPPPNPILDEILLNWTYLIGNGLVTLDGLTNNVAGTYGAATGCQISNTGSDWGIMPWTPYEINLCQYVGQEITIEATMYDCNQGGHYGWGYITCPVWSSCAISPVTVTKSNNPTGSVVAGQAITYTLSYKNTSAVNFDNGVVVNDTVPTGTTLNPNSLTSSPAMPETFIIGNDVGWDIGTLKPGDSGTLSYSVTVNNLPAGDCAETIVNQASWSDLLSCPLTAPPMVTDPVTNILGPTCTFTPTPVYTFTPAPTATVTPTPTATAGFTCPANDIYNGLTPATSLSAGYTWTDDATISEVSPGHLAGEKAMQVNFNWPSGYYAGMGWNFTNGNAALAWNLTPYNDLVLWVKSTGASVSFLQVSLRDATGATSNRVNITSYIAGGAITGTWQEVFIPLSVFTGINLSTFSEIDFNDGNTASGNDTVQFSDIGFVYSGPCWTNTPTPTNTPTNTATNTNTHTPTNTPTNTNTNTPTNTNTVTPTNTATNTNTNTPTNTNTVTPTNTPTNTNTTTPTNTPTNTNTNTPTNTPTTLFSNTPTNTPTPTPTNTPTVASTLTPTNTPTNTNTNTPTNTAINTYTPTNTPTVTMTNTPTNTSTITDTDTVTNTPTNTPTNTSTDTPRDTPTNTNTPTNTCTDTITQTPTNTYTFTNTATNTCTSTVTYTATNTSTNTCTNSPTMTPTNTESATNTPTQTFTYTPTSTPTVSVSMGKNVSETQAHAGDLLNYTIGVTVTGNNLIGAVITDTLPANVSFVSFGTAPPGTAPAFNAPTDQLKWIMPSPLAPGIYNLTYTTQVTSSLTLVNGPLINFAQLNYSGAPKPLTASVPVTMIGTFTVKVNIYNSAGEVVKTILVQAVDQPIDHITLSTTNLITTLKGPGSLIDILYNGYIIATWDGSDNQGQPVSNGNYLIQVDSTSLGGVVTSVSQTATVNRNLSNITVNIYNSAGELIRILYSTVNDWTGASMTDVVLSANIIRPSTSGPVTSGTPSQVDIVVNSSDGSAVTLVWDGTNNSGTDVTPGVYTVNCHWSQGSTNFQNIIRSVVVMGGITNTTVVARPNVLNAANGMITTFDGSGVANAYLIQVKLYTIAGELIQSLSSPAGTPEVNWNAAGFASGVYIAAVNIQNAAGGNIGVQRLKVLVLH
jgi:hypothetical protein